MKEALALLVFTVLLVGLSAAPLVARLRDPGCGTGPIEAQAPAGLALLRLPLRDHPLPRCLETRAEAAPELQCRGNTCVPSW